MYNQELTLEHQYLGTSLQLISGRLIIPDKTVVSMPLWPSPVGTIIPGQTFPITATERGKLNMLRKCHATDHTFGFVATSYIYDGEDEAPFYGTTAEIYEYADTSQKICAKARGRQRFKLISKTMNSEGYSMGTVEILPELSLRNPLMESNSLTRLRSVKRAICRRREAALTVWPAWVFDMYDHEQLMKRAEKELGFLKQGPGKGKGADKNICMPKDIHSLSYWVSSHLHADDKKRIIQMNCPIQRMRWLLSYLPKWNRFVCSSCRTEIAIQNDLFSMSGEGAQMTYVNPVGAQHDTMTFRKVVNVDLVTDPSTECSWFPGYAWAVAVCYNCRQHVGWQFTCREKNLRPTRFFGLTRMSLVNKGRHDNFLM